MARLCLKDSKYEYLKYMYHGTIQVPWYPMYQYDSIEPRFARVHERL